MNKLTLDRRATFLAGLAVLLAGGAPGMPSAAVGATAPLAAQAVPAAAPEGGWLRLGHFSPDTVAVDVRVSALSGGTVVLELQDVAYGDISGYQSLPAGTYAIGMIPSGSDDWTQLAVSDSVTVDPSKAATVAAYGPSDDLQVQAFADDLTPPSAGTARVRVIHTSTIVPSVDVQTTTGVVIADDAQSGSAAPYVLVRPGTLELELTGEGVSDEASVDVAAGTITTLFVLDTADGGLTVMPVIDSASPAVVPDGGVDTGGGWLGGNHSERHHAAARFGMIAV
ncbi:DUF4397 domain-containing protein [Micromonospora sp. DT81.3]|uniref:DUF4397 domain-containing protein n=1 Tax=Actinomycetes TaxID=1760 RepID=UPI003CF92E20